MQQKITSGPEIPIYNNFLVCISSLTNNNWDIPTLKNGSLLTLFVH